MALVLKLSPFGDEALATLLTATLDQVTTRLRLHAGTKTVLAFAGAFGWLISPFHRLV